MLQNDFYIVRHGESENNVLEIESSKIEHKDLHGLTDQGRKEVENQAKIYDSFDVIITSPFRRTKETAAIFAKYAHCEVIEDDRLCEVNAGDYELCTYKFTDDHSREFGEDVPYPNGESLQQARDRHLDFFKEINQRYSKQSVLIVAHGYGVKDIVEYIEPTLDWDVFWEQSNHCRQVYRLSK